MRYEIRTSDLLRQALYQVLGEGVHAAVEEELAVSEMILQVLCTTPCTLYVMLHPPELSFMSPLHLLQRFQPEEIQTHANVICKLLIIYLIGLDLMIKGIQSRG